MNTGTISARYAKALLKLVEETGRGDVVCAQVRQILAAPDTMPAVLEPELSKFVALVADHGREEYLKYMLHSFVQMYHKAHGIKVAHLTTAVESPELEQKLRQVIGASEVIFDTKVDPSLIGGFVLKVDDLLLDASVQRQLEIIRQQFEQRNRRIV